MSSRKFLSEIRESIRLGDGLVNPQVIPVIATCKNASQDAFLWVSLATILSGFEINSIEGGQKSNLL